jgi:hypothetical protein
LHKNQCDCFVTNHNTFITSHRKGSRLQANNGFASGMSRRDVSPQDTTVNVMTQ